VLICTLILTTGMVATAGMLAVTVQTQIGAREAARSMRLAQARLDELMKLDFDDDPEISPGGSLTANDANHFDASPDGLDGITVRWQVTPGPAGATDVTRIVTVRVVNVRAMQYRETDLATIVRSW
jgi:hypothetical protein